MIGRLKGELETLALDRVLVDVQGVGYEVSVPAGLSGRLPDDDEVTLYVHTNVRDDAIDLYGFQSRSERRLFERLTSVSGVGPKTALGIVSELRPEEIVKAVRTNSTDAFQTVKGVGEKTAQRLILDLKDSLNDLEFDELAPPKEQSEEDERTSNLRSALANFGYEAGTIDDVVGQMRDEIDDAEEMEPLLRQALDMLR